MKIEYSIAKLRLRFRARWFVSLAVLCLFCILLSLGFWQLARLEWKNEILAQIEARAELKAVDYVAQRSNFGEKDAFTRVRLVGKFDFANEQFLLRRHVDGRPGWHVFTPMILTDGAGVVLVNRGWVSFEQRDRETRAEKINQREAVVEGLLHLPSRAPQWLMPDNQPEKNLWYREDLPAMASSIANGSSEYSNGDAATNNESTRIETRWTIIADENPWGEFPQGRQWAKSIRNAHASYAATWFLLSLSLLAVFLVANTEILQQKSGSKSKIVKNKQNYR